MGERGFGTTVAKEWGSETVGMDRIGENNKKRKVEGNKGDIVEKREKREEWKKENGESGYRNKRVYKSDA